jgi:disulfide bond formation protein DsbB
VIPTIITFFAFLSLIALAGALSIWLSNLAGKRAWIEDVLGSAGLGLAWLVAVVATGGSLFLSEVAGFIPCSLCWVQRGFMYPLAVLLVIPAVRRRPPVGLVFWPLAGAAVSIYHYGIEHLPALENSGFCSASTPCSTIWVNEFGFITIPFMAMSGFLAIAALIQVYRKYKRTDGESK